MVSMLAKHQHFVSLLMLAFSTSTAMPCPSITFHSHKHGCRLLRILLLGRISSSSRSKGSRYLSWLESLFFFCHVHDHQIHDSSLNPTYCHSYLVQLPVTNRKGIIADLRSRQQLRDSDGQNLKSCPLWRSGWRNPLDFFFQILTWYFSYRQKIDTPLM